MSLPVIFQPAALAEIDAAFAWYELQASGVGAEFLRRVKLMELGIARDPLLYPFARAPLRGRRCGARTCASFPMRCSFWPSQNGLWCSVGSTIVAIRRFGLIGRPRGDCRSSPQRAELRDRFEASDLPFRVDVVEVDALPEGMAERVSGETLSLQDL